MDRFGDEHSAPGPQHPVAFAQGCGLPIDRKSDGLLAKYFAHIIEATGAPWTVEQLTQETYDRHREGWYPDLLRPVPPGHTALDSAKDGWRQDAT